ncbi:MAG: PAS domain S-box protein [Hahellaceae bacterium]|nr:PAS domain S-box protein [Hahellaceae bacterium]
MLFKLTRRPLQLLLAVSLFLTLILMLVELGERHERARAYREWDNLLKSQLEFRANHFKTALNEMHQDIQFLSSLPPIQGIARASANQGIDVEELSSQSQWVHRLNTIFSGYVASHKDVSQVRYLGIADHGRELVRVDSIQGLPAVIDGAELQQKADREYFIDTLKLNHGQVYLSDINLNREHGLIIQPPTPVLRAALPVDTAEGKRFGMIVTNINVIPLFNELLADLPAGVQLYIIDQEQVFLLHPDPEKTFGADLGTAHRWQSEFHFIPGDSLLPEQLKAVSQGKQSLYSRQINLPLRTQPSEATLQLILTVPQDQVNEAITKNLIRTTLVIVASLLLMGLLMYLAWLNTRQSKRTYLAQSRLAALVNSTDDAVMGVSLEGILTEWNTGAAKMFGYTAADAIGHPLIQLLIPEDSATEALQRLTQIKTGGRVSQYITQMRCRNGRLLDVSLSAAPIFNAKGEIVGEACTVRDISSQKALDDQIHRLNASLEQQVAERTAELQQHMHLQQAILEQAGTAIIVTDTRGLITLFNPAAERILGYAAEEMIGQQTPAAFHLAEEVARRATEFSKALNVNLPPGFDVLVVKADLNLPNTHEWTYRRKDGALFPVQLSITALRDAHGNINGYLGIATDISEQAQAKRHLLSMHDQLLKAAEVAELGIWSYTLADKRLEWNQQMRNMYQTPEAIHRQGLYYEHWLNAVHPEDKEATVTKLNQAIEGTAVYDPIFRIIRPDGSLRYIQAAAVVEKENGHPVRVLGINRDITNQRDYEQHLFEAKEAADKANEAKSAFLANMSHEIRTPMNAILGILQLLQHTHLDQKQADYVSKTQTAAKALLGILNDILDFSKVEAGKLSLDPQPCQIDKVLRELGVILDVNRGHKNLEVLFDIDATLPEQIIVDELRLQQILLNLAGNALKFTTQGEVVISVKVVHQEADQVSLAFSVRDTGIGIAPELLDQIFEGFTQAEASTARRFGGTGLGLAISQRLVRLMGGELRAHSSLGQGSTFSFEITCPYLVGQSPKAADNVLLPQKVLVVDDNATAREVLVAMIRSFGWSADAAGSGQEALALMKHHHSDSPPYSLILMDWHMPEMDGWEASEKIRELYPANELPLIVMVTAHSRESLAENQARFPTLLNGFLTKPITTSMLLNEIAEARAGFISASSIQSASDHPLQGLSLLLVEDNPMNREIAIELLKSEGARVQVAVNGFEAVASVKEAANAFDAVLMDIQMPGMDGYQATRAIRETLNSTELPIIAMTANAFASDREAAMAAGMNDHVGKPFELKHLVETILKYTRPTTQTLSTILSMTLAMALPLSTPLMPCLTRFPGWMSRGHCGVCEANKPFTCRR